MKYSNKVKNILCQVYCKHFTVLSLRVIYFLLLLLCSFESIKSQNLNIDQSHENTKSQNSAFNEKSTSQLRNLQYVNDKSQNLKYSDIGVNKQQDSELTLTKDNHFTVNIPRDYNYFLYDAEPYLQSAENRVRRTPFTRKKPSRPIHHIHKTRPSYTTKRACKDEDDEVIEEKKCNEEKDEDENEEERDEDNDDYDYHGRDCEQTERCKSTKSCEKIDLCETTESSTPCINL